MDKWLVTLSTWTDDIKSTLPGTRNWHFIDLPVDQNYAPKDVAGYLKTNSDNVVSQIDAEIRYFKEGDIRKNNPQDFTNLMFLLHFVGDVEQPLHCSDLLGDKGGNGRVVTNVLYKDLYGKTTGINLHLLWDFIVDTNDIRDYSNKRDALMASMPRDIKPWWTNSNPADWAYDSYTNGIEIYSYLKITNGSKSKTGIRDFSAYQARYQKIAGLQLEKGGFRLAYLLNQMFGK